MISVLLLALSSCKHDDPPDVADEPPSVILGVEATGSVVLPGLAAPVQVLYNTTGVPTIFGETDADVARVHGYLIARDRFFFLDLSRRLGLGTVSELLGQDGLSSDIESRQRGQTAVTELIVAELDTTPSLAAYVDGYAAGINAYIDDVAAGELSPPAEFELLAPLIGFEPVEALQPFTRRDVAASMAFFLFEIAWEPGDVSRASDELRLDTLFDGAPLEALRKAGARKDVFERVIPAVDTNSAPGWVPADSPPPPPAVAHTPKPPRPPAEMLDALLVRLDHTVKRLGKDREAGFGSNTWAVSGDHTASGHALLAADPHLPLSIPSIMWLVGLDTRELGGGDLHIVGHQATPLFFMASGTNGDIAWGQTNTGGGDITDWYAESITLDAQGAPASSLFGGELRPLVETVDTYHIADVPVLGSVGRTEEISRYQTFDGRWINSIEGRLVEGPGDAGPGETAVNLMGQWVVPADIDGVDGITAVSFDYTGFDMRGMVGAIDRGNRAKSVEEFIEASRDFVAYGLHIVVADTTGSILYTPYMAMPCRSYLPRNPDGSWVVGADPKKLIDGTRYGGFQIPATPDGHVDFSWTDDPARCVVPWESHPWAIDPAQGFLASANSDPGGLSLDGSLTNDGYYLGGPWSEGFRMDEIHQELAAFIERGDVTLEDLRQLQADHHSTIGRWLAPVLVDAIEASKAASAAGADDGVEGRLAALYDADNERYDDVADRLRDWGSRGYLAEAGVETFYYGAPTAEQRADAVATMIFNAWMGPYLSKAVGDEGMPTGDTGTFGVLRMMLESRGAGNPGGFASYNPDTEESVYWDVLSTPDVETSDEVAMLALIDALVFLESPPDGSGGGGFGTSNAEEWLWGLKHWVVFEPLLLELLGSELQVLVEDFQIDSNTFPIALNIPSGDPRLDVPGFPRHSDHKNVDAANCGTSGTTFDNSYGPTARLVVELGPDGARGINALPGGQSSDPDAEHFSDQARLWLGNEALPISTIPAEIAKNAVRRETFSP